MNSLLRALYILYKGGGGASLSHHPHIVKYGPCDLYRLIVIGIARSVFKGGLFIPFIESCQA